MSMMMKIGHEINLKLLLKFYHPMCICVSVCQWKERKKMMENICEDELSVKEMELMEPNYEVFMRWAQPTTIWDTYSNRIKIASIR